MTVGEALAAYFRARIDEPKSNDAPDVAEAKRRNAGSRRYLTTLFATDAAGTDLRGLPLGYVGRLTRADVRDRRRKLLASKGVPTVNRCTSYFSAFLTWAMDELEGLESNPLAGLRREAGEQEAPREVVASPEELRAMWKATGGAEIAVDFARIWRLAVLTGMRRSEIAGLKVTDVQGDLIHVSRAKTDAGRRCVPMSDPARQIVENAIADKGDAGPYIFATSTRGARPFGNFSKQASKLHELAGLQRDVTLHDLRRGVVTRLAALGIDRTVVKLLVGHARGDANARVYDQHTYLREMRAAVDALAEDVGRVVSNSAGATQGGGRIPV
ncbi:MAG: tyrosine-type recombinase/integrase [Planctomycetales bacterium]|nr:tyrosine-type recombinase/integrase [Planctomycetales bacterium]